MSDDKTVNIEDGDILKAFGVENTFQLSDSISDDPDTFFSKVREIALNIHSTSQNQPAEPTNETETKNDSQKQHTNSQQSFIHADDAKKAEIAKMGITYDDLVDFSTDLGITKISDTVINLYALSKNSISQNSANNTTITMQNRNGAGNIPTGERSNSQQPETFAQKAVANKKYLL